jgi:hypothetical protein
MDNINRDDSLRVFRNVVRSLMKDASRAVADVDAAADPGELKERLDLVGHYIRYTLRYCAECPLVKEEPAEFLPFKAIEFPGAS